MSTFFGRTTRRNSPFFHTLILVMSLTISAPGAASEIVYVLVGLTSEADVDGSAIDLAAELTTGMPIIMARSGMADKEFAFLPYPINVAYTEPSDHDSVAAHGSDLQQRDN